MLPFLYNQKLLENKSIKKKIFQVYYVIDKTLVIEIYQVFDRVETTGTLSRSEKDRVKKTQTQFLGNK